jgi:hypothetical protein
MAPGVSSERGAPLQRQCRPETGAPVAWWAGLGGRGNDADDVSTRVDEQTDRGATGNLVWTHHALAAERLRLSQ